MAEIKDYLHLYLGCKIIVSHRNQPDYESTLLPSFLGDPSGVRLILRPLSSMTEEDLVEIYAMNLDGNNDKYGEFSKRYMANCASQDLKEYAVVAHLLKKGFDLFGLIDAGLAIDKTKSL